MMRKSVCLLSMLVCFSLSTRAQDEVPRVEVFGGYSLLRPNIPADAAGGGTEGEAAAEIAEFALGNVLGWGASVTVNVTGALGITADFSGHYKSLDVSFEGDRIDASADLHTFLFGPTITMRSERVSPFVHALFGIGRVGAEAQVNGESAEFDETGFAAAAGGGVDIIAHPNVAVRAIEFDYFPFRNSDGDTFTFNNFRWRSGIVLRF